MTITRPLSLSVCAALTFLVAACSGTPTGSSGGRIDPSSTTEQDLRSRRANIADLRAFGDQAATQLAQDLSAIEQIKRAPSKVVLELGSIENKTNTPTTDFEMLRTRLRDALLQSKLMRDHFMFVESRSRMEAELARIDGAAGQGTARYDPAQTYVLQGDFYEAVREGRQQFYLEFKLTNLATREIVAPPMRYDMAQLR